MFLNTYHMPSSELPNGERRDICFNEFEVIVGSDFFTE